MTADKELLIAAAKSLGYEQCWNGEHLLWTRSLADAGKTFFHQFWNPLKDDGTALQLAAALELRVDMMHGCIEVTSNDIDGDDYGCPFDVLGTDKMASIRRAIVMVAAELGRRK